MYLIRVDVKDIKIKLKLSILKLKQTWFCCLVVGHAEDRIVHHLLLLERVQLIAGHLIEVRIEVSLGTVHHFERI